MLKGYYIKFPDTKQILSLQNNLYLSIIAEIVKLYKIFLEGVTSNIHDYVLFMYT